MDKDQNKLYFLIDELLWKEWDPIGINDVEDARDEYQSYVPAILKLKIDGAKEADIADYLFEIVTDNMGLFGNRETCSEIAFKICQLEF
jgi:predicted choloylglycine hydrolase